MSKPNFRIVDGNPEKMDKDYQRFKDAYLNRLGTSLTSIGDELGITHCTVHRFSVRAMEETGLKRYWLGNKTILAPAPVKEETHRVRVDYEAVYDDFMNDYLNKDLSMNDLIHKYDLGTRYVYSRMVRLVRDRTGWTRRNHNTIINKITGEKRVIK